MDHYRRDRADERIENKRRSSSHFGHSGYAAEQRPEPSLSAQTAPKITPRKARLERRSPKRLATKEAPRQHPDLPGTGSGQQADRAMGTSPRKKLFLMVPIYRDTSSQEVINQHYILFRIPN